VVDVAVLVVVVAAVLEMDASWRVVDVTSAVSVVVVVVGRVTVAVDVDVDVVASTGSIVVVAASVVVTTSVVVIPPVVPVADADAIVDNGSRSRRRHRLRSGSDGCRCSHRGRRGGRAVHRRFRGRRTPRPLGGFRGRSGSGHVRQLDGRRRRTLRSNPIGIPILAIGAGSIRRAGLEEGFHTVASAHVE